MSPGTSLLRILLRGGIWSSRSLVGPGVCISNKQGTIPLLTHLRKQLGTFCSFVLLCPKIAIAGIRMPGFTILSPCLETVGVVASRTEGRCLCHQQACPFLYWKPSDGLHHCGWYLPLPLLPVSVLHGVSGVSEHQREAVQPAGHEQSPAAPLRGEQTFRLVWELVTRDSRAPARCVNAYHTLTYTWRGDTFIADTHGGSLLSCGVSGQNKSLNLIASSWLVSVLEFSVVSLSFCPQKGWTCSAGSSALGWNVGDTRWEIWQGGIRALAGVRL